MKRWIFSFAVALGVVVLLAHLPTPSSTDNEPVTSITENHDRPNVYTPTADLDLPFDAASFGADIPAQ